MLIECIIYIYCRREVINNHNHNHISSYQWLARTLPDLYITTAEYHIPDGQTYIILYKYECPIAMLSIYTAHRSLTHIYKYVYIR